MEIVDGATERGWRKRAERKRQSFYVIEPDIKGDYTLQVFDPLGAVIGYLRNERWNESKGRNEAEREYALRDAIYLCVDVYNKGD